VNNTAKWQELEPAKIWCHAVALLPSPRGLHCDGWKQLKSKPLSFFKLLIFPLQLHRQEEKSLSSVKLQETTHFCHFCFLEVSISHLITSYTTGNIKITSIVYNLHGLDQMMSPGTIIRGVARTQFSDEQRKNFRLHSGWELASLNLEGKIEN